MNNLFMQAVMRSPTYIAVAAEADAALVAERQAIIDQLSEIDRERTIDLGNFNTKESKLSAEVRDLEEQLNVARSQLSNVRSAWMSKDRKADIKRSALLEGLETTINPALRKFHSWCEQVANDLRWKASSTTVLADESGRFDQQARMVFAANPIIAVCRQAQQWAVECKYKALPEVEIVATIERYVDEIYEPAQSLSVSVARFSPRD